MKRLLLLTCISVLLSASIFFFKRSRANTTVAAGEGLIVNKEWLKQNKTPLTPVKDRRPADQTFLTFPEWYLVFSPEEQADYFKKYTSTSFPFMSHTAQIWESYKIVNDQIKGNFPPNGGYHFMIWVIGSSASAEYSIKALYETLVGRITDTHTVETEEDRFNAQFTDDYVKFIKDRPWYEFDFKSRIRTLWGGTPFFGDHFLRKFERRYILSSELLVKYGYGKLIGLGTKSVYEEALPTTEVVMEDNKLMSLPRYDQFNKEATRLALDEHSFKEIAGNNSAILVTVLLPSSQPVSYERSQVLFTQIVASNQMMKRVAIITRVPDLHHLLKKLNEDHVMVEHVFDY